MEHSLPYVVNCSILFTEVPRSPRPAAAAAAGFAAVKFWWPFPASVPTDAEVDAFVAAVQDAGAALTALNSPAGGMPAGDRGLVPWPDLYHRAVNAANTSEVGAVGAAIAQHRARIGHVQIADAPGRHEPGTATPPLQHCLRDPRAGGYQGRVGLEYVPVTATGAVWAGCRDARRGGGPATSAPATSGHTDPGES